jgi:biotin transport system ATP-binding protein
VFDNDQLSPSMTMHSHTLSSQPHSTTGISLSNIRLQRGNTVVFENLSIHLGEARIGLIGDNGAGKSSLFRLICGLDVPQSGEVKRPHGPHSVGMLFQNPDEQIIFPTVEEELALSLSHLNLSRAQAQTHVRDWLHSRGLADWAARAIGNLSQGQRQHVCWLALVIAAHQTLLLDEPYSSLDLPNQALLHRDIEHAKEQIIVSTHVLDHVRHFDRVIWLDKGTIRLDGPGHDVCAAYEMDVASRAG